MEGSINIAQPFSELLKTKEDEDDSMTPDWAYQARGAKNSIQEGWSGQC